MERFETTITLHAPVEKVFAFAKDVGKLWASYPGIAVRDVVLTPDGVGSHAGWYTKMLFLHQEGSVEYTEVVPLQRIVAKSSTGRVFTFTFTPREDGDTDLTYAEEWTLDVPVVGRTMESIATRMGAGYIHTFIAIFSANVKAAVEGVAPEPVQPQEEKPGATLTRSVTINVPVENVFDFVLDIGTFLMGAPDVAVREVKLTPEGVGNSARLYSHAGAIHMEGFIEVVEVVRNERIVAKAAFGPESPRWTFTVEPVDGGTKLEGRGEWHVGIPGVGGRLETWAATSHAEFLEEALASAKQRVEAAA